MWGAARVKCLVKTSDLRLAEVDDHYFFLVNSSIYCSNEVILKREAKMNETKKAEKSSSKASPKRSSTITGRIYAKALELLEQHPEGLRFTELRTAIEEAYPNFHPKTVNGCVWKLVQKFPEKVYKPSRGRFRLLKYRSSDGDTS